MSERADIFGRKPSERAVGGDLAAQLAGYRWPRVVGPRLLTTVEVGGVVRARFEAELAAIEADYQRSERARLAACMVRRRGR